MATTIELPDNVSSFNLHFSADGNWNCTIFAFRKEGVYYQVGSTPADAVSRCLQDFHSGRTIRERNNERRPVKTYTDFDLANLNLDLGDL